MGRSIAVAAACLLVLASGLAGQRTDVVVLVNGDAITGEIKSLDRGALTYKTDDAGTLSIKWEKVVSLRSTDTFEVELLDGRRVYGPVEESPDSLHLRVAGEDIPLDQAVRITPIEATFVDRTSGYLDLGYTFAKAKKASTLTFEAEARYRGRVLESMASGSFYRQDQDSSSQTVRTSIDFSGAYRLSRRWATTAFGELSRNDELSLRLRTLFGAGAQLRVFHTNFHEATAISGIVGTRERYADEGSARWSMELAAAGDYAAYRLVSPKLDITASTVVYFSLTESGRVRSDMSGRVSYELFSDFFAAITVNATLDSKPPTSDASKSDYNTAISVGWSW